MVSLVLSSCITARQEFEFATNRLEAALDAFVDARHEYPRTLQELSAFATASGRPLDLTPFAKVRLERPSRSRVMIYLDRRDRPNESVTVMRVTTS
jgi:hypothetical protein